LFPATWITLILFFILDYVLLGKTYSITKVVFNFMGFLTTDPPNGPAWYITYILFLYALYFLISTVQRPVLWRIAILLILSYSSSVLIWRFAMLGDLIRVWTFYAMVFPCAVAIGMYSKQIQSMLDAMLKARPVMYLFLTASLLALYFSRAGLEEVSHLVSKFPFKHTMIVSHEIVLVCALIMITRLMDRFGMVSKGLMWLGRYSFEIFLIHDQL